MKKRLPRVRASVPTLLFLGLILSLFVPVGAASAAQQPRAGNGPSSCHPADPDGDENGGADCPGGSGGTPGAQDPNNGSGNDSDCEDDNNGNGTPGHCPEAPSGGEAASAGSPDSAESGDAGVGAVAGAQDTPTAATAGASDEALPFTGAPTWLAALLGVVLLAAGSVLHLYGARATRQTA